MLELCSLFECWYSNLPQGRTTMSELEGWSSQNLSPGCIHYIHDYGALTYLGARRCCHIRKLHPYIWQRKLGNMVTHFKGVSKGHIIIIIQQFYLIKIYWVFIHMDVPVRSGQVRKRCLRRRTHRLARGHYIAPAAAAARRHGQLCAVVDYVPYKRYIMTV